MNSVIGVMLAVTILSAGNVRAEEQGFEPTLTAQPSMSTGLKSPGTATGLSFAGLVVPIGISAMVLSSGSGGGSGDVGLGVLIVAGTILGPGLGHAYAGESGRFWRGAGLRTLSWGAMIGAAADHLVGTSCIKRVVFVLFDQAGYAAFREHVEKLR